MNKDEYWEKVNEVYARYRELGTEGWRFGQTAFNVLHMNFPQIANDIRGTSLDPYNWSDSVIVNNDLRWVDFVQFIEAALPNNDYVDPRDVAKWEGEGGLTF
jgi:hypothetical protein